MKMTERSFEVLHGCILPRGMKAVAGHLGLSQALLYKWCLSPQQSGTLNPLDRISELVRFLQDPSGNCDWSGGGPVGLSLLPVRCHQGG